MDDAAGKDPTPRRLVKFADRPPSAVERRVRFVSSTGEGAVRGLRHVVRSSSVTADAPASVSVPEISYRLNSGTYVRVIASSEACEQIASHCRASNDHGREVGGILVGERSVEVRPDGYDQFTVCVTDIIPVESRSSSHSHVQFDTAAWASIEAAMAERFLPQQKCRLGWYHTHPTQGIFFSPLDADAHSVFRQPYQFAVVVDPRTMQAGLFYRRDPATRELGGPVRFSLELGGRRGGWSGRRRPSWSTVTGSIICLGAMMGTAGFQAFSGRMSMFDATLLVAGTIISATLCATQFPMFSPRWGWAADSRLVDAGGLGALVLLTFWSGSRLGQELASGQPVERTTATRKGPSVGPRDNPAVIAGTSEFPPPANGGQAPSGDTFRFMVDQKRIASRTFQVRIADAERRASVAYQLRRCKGRGRAIVAGSCTILLDSARESAFLRGACRNVPIRSECVQNIQRGLGFTGSGLDGIWGRKTRLRFINQALRARSDAERNVAKRNVIFVSRAPRQRPG